MNKQSLLLRNKIVNIEKAVQIVKKLKQQGKKIVLAGGCFDIIHVGHVEFLKKAKEKGTVLFILLESDEKVKQIKGKNRPIHTQKERAKVLSVLEMVDYVILLPYLAENKDYDNLVMQLKPDIIATTKADRYKIHKERQAKLLNAQVLDVIERLPNKSTNLLALKLSQEL